MLRIYIDKNIFSYLKRGEDPQIIRLKSLLDYNKNILFIPFSNAHIQDLLSDKTDLKFADVEFMEQYTRNYYLSYDALKHHTNYFLARPIDVLYQALVNTEPRLENIMDLFGETDDPALQKIRESLKVLLEMPLYNLPIDTEKLRPQDEKYIDKFLPQVNTNLSLADFFTQMQNTDDLLRDKTEFKEMRRYNLENLPRLTELENKDKETINMALKNSAFGKDLDELIEQHNQTGKPQTLNNKFISGFMLLNFFGLDKERNNKANFTSLSNDAQHSFYASYCDILITEDKGLKIKSEILYENFGIKTKVLKIEEFLKFYDDYNKGSTISSLTDLFNQLTEDMIPENIAKTISSTSFNRETLIYNPTVNYFDYFNKIELILDEEHGKIIVLSSKRDIPQSYLFYDEFAIIVNKVVTAFGIDVHSLSVFSSEDLEQIKVNLWKGRTWVLPSAIVILENNSGTDKLSLSINLSLLNKTDE